jgi:FkbH-like protein
VSPNAVALKVIRGASTELKRILDQIHKHLVDDTAGTLPSRFSKTIRLGASYAKEVGLGALFLRECDEVGQGARIKGGRPLVDNRGHISIGARSCFLTQMGPLMLRTGPLGRLSIGDGAILNFGTLISASARVALGNRVSIGQYCLICDTDGADPAPDALASPIEIADGAWLAARVTVLPGARIGKGSVITAGSIVSGEIPDGVVAGGIPARVLRRLVPGESAEKVAPIAERSELSEEAFEATPASALRVTREAAAQGYIVSDFTIGELERRLNATDESMLLDFEAAPFGQVVPSLLAPPPPGREFLVVWTRPEAVLPDFDALLAGEARPEAEILRQVDEFCELVLRAAAQYRAVFVPTWAVSPFRRQLGMLDARDGGATHALGAMNLRLMDRLAAASNVFVLNAQRWLELVGRNAQQPRLWYRGKVPFHADVFAEAASDIRAALSGLAGAARKLLILDLDDTLWGGVVGDVGVDGLRLGGHDSVGEAFVDFQRAVKELERRGVVLALVSKNTESVALEALRTHPAMVLREQDFVGYRINWNDKARNIAELVSEQNLGLSAVVFIDDNPVERARVREALPEVLVPEWPEDKLLYASTLRALPCFDAPTRSREDAERTELYAAERARQSLKIEVGSLDDWLSSLRTRVRVSALDHTNLARTAQLLGKTNQMNLRTRRVTERELESWASAPNREVWAVTVSDRFGDAGLTGVVSLEYRDGTAQIEDFVLSCRVMGRKVEETLLHVAVASARRRNARRVEAHYLETAKNKPCLEFWQRAGFSRDGAVFSWDTARAYECPPAITLVGAE